MRPRLALAVALGLAMVVPATTFAAGSEATSLSDTAIASYLSPDQSQCAILTLAWVAQRSPGGALNYSQHLSVQLSGPTCQPSTASNGVDLEASDYHIVGLTNAWVDKALTVAGHPVRVDVAWTATGSPQIYSSEGPPEDTVVITRDVKAHLSGTVAVDGVAWTANQENALLRSGTWTTFAAAPTTAAPAPAPVEGPSSSQPATTTVVPAGTTRHDGPLVPGLALLLLGAGAAVACSAASAARRSR